MLIYFDMNIYNRMFDDQEQLKIKLETTAIDIIFQRVQEGQFNLLWSFILEYENSRNPFIQRRSKVQVLSQLSSGVILKNDIITGVAKNIVENSKARIEDALHIACSIYAGCRYYMTCDGRLIRTIYDNMSNLQDILGGTEILNPIDFLRKEMNLDVIG